MRSYFTDTAGKAGLALAACLIMLLTATAALAAQGAAKYPGWERGSTYNELYDAAKYTQLKGELVEFIDITPLSDMAPGLGLIMTTKDGENVTVHLGPEKYLGFLRSGFKAGDRIKVKGAWATVSGLPVFMASKIRLNEVFEIKFRSTRSGTPYWDLTDAELIEEQLE